MQLGICKVVARRRLEAIGIAKGMTNEGRLTN